MDKPNVNNCSKKVKEYIDTLERLLKREKKRNEILSNTLNESSKKSNIYQYPLGLLNHEVKSYLQEDKGVYFNIDDHEIEFILKKDCIEIISNIMSLDKELCIVPRASNVIKLKIK